MSKISCMLVVSECCSGLFQGILESPKMMIFLELGMRCHPDILSRMSALLPVALLSMVFCR